MKGPSPPSDKEALGDLVGRHKQNTFRRFIIITSRLAILSLTLTTIALFLYSKSLTTVPLGFRPPPPVPSHSLSGWFDRAERFNGTFRPSPSTLAWVHTLLSPPEKTGSLVAGFFDPDFVVNGRGTVSQLLEEDWRGLRSLAVRAATELPETGNLTRDWTIRQSDDGAARQMDWLGIVGSPGEKIIPVSVYGYDERTDELEEAVGPYHTLPPVLKDLVGLMREAWTWHDSGVVEDLEMIERVKAVLRETMEQ